MAGSVSTVDMSAKKIQVRYFNLFSGATINLVLRNWKK